jgi:hypothetical protein
MRLVTTKLAMVSHMARQLARAPPRHWGRVLNRGGEAARRRKSAFIEEAVRAKLRPDPRSLDKAYKAASKERWRARLGREWSAIEVEAWPEW